MSAHMLQVSDWLNTDRPIELHELHGKVVLIEAFQMLCPACVSHALPQAMRVGQLFPPDDLVVIGLHTVFEHHGAQGTREALEAFLHEYRIDIPVAIDKPSADGCLPHTMQAYRMRGTPTTLLFDRDGDLRKQQFGVVQDLALGAEVASLLGEPPPGGASLADPTGDQCGALGCALPSTG